MLVTFALYPAFPIACEGDDTWTDSVELGLLNSTPEEACSWLTELVGGYVQVWGSN
jgi:hypothetical protein